MRWSGEHTRATRQHGWAVDAAPWRLVLQRRRRRRRRRRALGRSHVHLRPADCRLLHTQVDPIPPVYAWHQKRQRRRRPCARTSSDEARATALAAAASPPPHKESRPHQSSANGLDSSIATPLALASCATCVEHSKGARLWRGEGGEELASVLACTACFLQHLHAPLMSSCTRHNTPSRQWATVIDSTCTYLALLGGPAPRIVLRRALEREHVCCAVLCCCRGLDCWFVRYVLHAQLQSTANGTVGCAEYDACGLRHGL